MLRVLTASVFDDWLWNLKEKAAAGSIQVLSRVRVAEALAAVLRLVVASRKCGFTLARRTQNFLHVPESTLRDVARR